jgi:proteasome lid subunit RPN8/RPN11
VTTLRLKPAALAAIIAAAEAATPEECCGLLVGRRDGAVLQVVQAVAAPNIAPDPARHFEVDPAILLTTHREARNAGLEVLGPYHSHPGGEAQPSATDTVRAADAGMGGEVWLIVPVSGNGAGGAGIPRAFVFEGQGFTEITVEERG